MNTGLIGTLVAQTRKSIFGDVIEIKSRYCYRLETHMYDKGREGLELRMKEKFCQAVHVREILELDDIYKMVLAYASKDNIADAIRVMEKIDSLRDMLMGNK